ncbi:MAG TPA: DNA polymerase III subunit gamma and tau [Micromonosporaceae bacterium]
MALALYRKYRPRTFAEVIGQEHVTEPLSQALRSGRLHHAYLFSGPRGCGKTSSARILARSLNCVQGPTPDPCGECESCRALAPDGPGSIDVIEIDAASHGGVDDARDLRERAFFAPVSSRFKVYVIDEAHMVSSAGFNALLKLVEEPPEYVKFVFATTEPEKVLGTIKSRTHHYPFRLIPPGVLRPYLEQLCRQEGVTVEPAVFPLVVRAGGGSARDSLSVLDQLIAGAGPEGVTYPRAVALLGVTDVALIDEMCDAIAAGDGAAAYATIDRVVEAGHDPRRFASDLLERLRDLIVLREVPDAVAKGLLDAPSDQLERMSQQAQRFGAATLSRCADIVHNGLTEMRGTTAPRLLLELIAARMLLPAADASEGALLQRLERLERRLTSGGAAMSGPEIAAPATPAAEPAPAVPRTPTPTAPVRDAGRPTAVRQESGEDPGPTSPASPTPIAGPAPAAAPAPPGAVDAAAVRRAWDDIVAMARRRSQKVAAVLRDATVREVEGSTLVLLFKYEFHAQTASASEELLLDALYEVFGSRWQVRCEVAGGGPVAGGRASGTPSAASPPRAPAPARQTQGGATRGAPARPRTPSRPATSSSAPSGADDEDWPTTATPGGVAEAAGSVAAPTPEPPGAAARTAAPAVSGAPASPPPRSAAPAVSGVPASPPARSAAPAYGAGPGRGATTPARGTTAPGRPAARTPGRGAPPTPTARGSARSAAAQPTASAGDWAGAPDEPPYDPDYDGPIRDAVSYEGFDPGDEPLDDVIDEQTARVSSEEQALRLLEQTLGAQRIGEVDPR